MTTPSGFQNHHKSLEEWEGYVLFLRAEISRRDLRIKLLRACGKTKEAQHLRAQDAIRDHLIQAEEEVAKLKALRKSG